MRNQYFSFQKEPFMRDIPPSDIFMFQGHRELLARMRHLIETGCLGVITGQVGSGKSTAVRSVMHNTDVSRYRFIYLAQSELKQSDLYRNLLSQLNIQPKRYLSDNKRLFNRAMLEHHTRGVKPIVVIDEAQELSTPMLGEMRFILNYGEDSFSPLTLLLVGQTRLRENLKLQILECIRQRVSVFYELPALEEDEVNQYILQHLRAAGLDKQVFTDEAVKLVYQFSKGIPRRINNICRYAIIAALEASSSSVDVEAVQKGIDDSSY